MKRPIKCIYRSALHLLVLPVLLMPVTVFAQKNKKEEVVEMSGISIIGNRELPKTLFIVPWKNSEVGVETELSNTLDEGMKPVDRDVFQRELDYYYFTQSSPP